MDEIVVGVDGSASSRAALRWAAGEARLHQRPLEVLCALDRLRPVDANGVLAGGTEDRSAVAGRLVHVIREELGASMPPLLAVDVVDREAFDALREAAGRAALVVVGRRLRSRCGRLVYECLGDRLVSHGHVAVALVPEGWRPGSPDPLGDIAIGVDGSDAAMAAFEWASEEAARRRHLAERTGAQHAEGPVIEVVAAHGLHDLPPLIDVTFVGAPSAGHRRSWSGARHLLDRGRCPVVVVPPGRAPFGVTVAAGRTAS